MAHVKKCGDFGSLWEAEGKPTSLAIVFVHGWFGDHESTWTWTRLPMLPRSLVRRVHLCDLLTADTALPYSYYCMTHSAGPLSSTGISTIAVELRTFLSIHVQSPHVILVAHSLGGLVCREAILQELEAHGSGAVRATGLLMFGTPNNGTEVAQIAHRYLRSQSAGQMKPLSEYLEGLNRRWAEHIINGGDPRLELGKRLTLLCRSVVGTKDKVVPRESSASLSYLGDLQAIEKDHRGLAKAKDSDDDTFRAVKAFIREYEGWLLGRPLGRAADRLSETIRRSMVDTSWTLEEHDLVRLAHSSSLPRQFGGKLLECEVDSVRKGVNARAEFAICVSLEPFEPTDLEIDYLHVIGRGLLSADEYKALAGAFSDSCIDPVQLEPFLRVESISIQWAGRREDYTFDHFIAKPGYAVLTYKCGADLVSCGRQNEMRLCFRTIISPQHGWYRYFVARTVLDKLRVELQAPFPVVALPHFWWQDVGPDEGPLGPGAYFSRITVAGPVPPGTHIDWMFVQEAD